MKVYNTSNGTSVTEDVDTVPPIVKFGGGGLDLEGGEGGGISIPEV